MKTLENLAKVETLRELMRNRIFRKRQVAIPFQSIADI